MRRGDVWTANLEPARGAEANKVRPVIIVSNNARNTVSATTGQGVLTIVPLTSSVDWVADYQLRIPANPYTGLTRESKAQAEQIRSIDTARMGTYLGHLPDGLLRDLDQRLRLQLAL
jgi:mRNA interferase MazF